ncbi:PilW family protein [Ectothiorhodospira shaposhnikovii]|uniref:PilW family protein n=1 Tax=Ectothiorhodospira shaposhnikovii TaxID=1054 RepID=UPI0039A1FA68
MMAGLALMKKKYYSRRFSSGFSLVELMIAMVLGLIVLAGVGHVFLSARMSYTDLQRISAMQDNVGFLSDYLVVSLRGAENVVWDSSDNRLGFQNGDESYECFLVQGQFRCEDDDGVVVELGGGDDFLFQSMDVGCMTYDVGAASFASAASCDVSDNAVLVRFEFLVVSGAVESELVFNVALRNRVINMI